MKSTSLRNGVYDDGGHSLHRKLRITVTMDPEDGRASVQKKVAARIRWGMNVNKWGVSDADLKKRIAAVLGLILERMLQVGVPVKVVCHGVYDGSSGTPTIIIISAKASSLPPRTPDFMAKLAGDYWDGYAEDIEDNGAEYRVSAKVVMEKE